MQTIQDELLERMKFTPQQYHRLIIMLNQDYRNINEPIKNIVNNLNLNYINLGLNLSKKLLDLTERQRALKIPQLIEQLIGCNAETTPLLDHIEILFEPALKQDPLRLLQGLSRNRAILVIWNGQVENNYLTYAEPEHPEYHQYPIHDLNILSLTNYAE